MQSPLIVALVLSSVFGTAIIFLALYFTHRYIHLRYLELDHWLHVLTPTRWRTACPHCRGTGVHHQSTRSYNYSRKRPKSIYAWRMDMRRGITNDVEWYAQDGTQMQMQGPRPAMLMPARGAGQLYNPWAGWHGQDCPQNGAYRQAQRQALPQGVPQAMQHGVPAMSNQQQLPRRAAYPNPQRRHHTHLNPTAWSQPAPQTRDRPRASRAPQVHQTDYIHIVEQYPPIVQANLKNAAPRKSSPRKKKATSPLSRNSTSSDATEEVPRASIPKAMPRFSANTNSAYPAHPNALDGDGGAKNRDRYASSSTNLGTCSGADGG